MFDLTVGSAEALLKKVTCVHKANIMKLGDGLFLNTFRRVAEEYKPSGIAYDDMIVDNTCVYSLLIPSSLLKLRQQIDATRCKAWPI